MYQTLQRAVALATSRNDILLAFILVGVVFMMILPLPTWLVDTLIAINMTLSAILLMVAMYLPSPLSFSSFPSVLLVTTLFRLAISISHHAPDPAARRCGPYRRDIRKLRRRR